LIVDDFIDSGIMLSVEELFWTLEIKQKMMPDLEELNNEQDN
jgi:hypothetical protein